MNVIMKGPNKTIKPQKNTKSVFNEQLNRWAKNFSISNCETFQQLTLLAFPHDSDAFYLFRLLHLIKGCNFTSMLSLYI